MFTGNEIRLPDSMLLMHDVAAYDATILIDDEGTVPAFADGTYGTLRNAVSIVGIAELIAGLLLHVIGYDTLVGNGCPYILVLVDIDYVWLSLNAHAGIDRFHVTLKILRLWMIDAVACRRLYPQRTLQRLLNADDVAVG